MTNSSPAHLRPVTGVEGAVGVAAVDHQRTAGIDIAAAETAVADLLRALGYDPHSEQFKLTPQRVVQNFCELTDAPELSPSFFNNPDEYDEPVVLRNIPFVSLCEHHLLPFHGVVHVGYAPTGNIVGLSTLAHVIEHFARSPQIQERLTTQVANYLAEHLSSRGVGVTIEAEHSCVTTRGVRARGSAAVTQAFRGELADDENFRSLFRINAASERP